MSAAETLSSAGRRCTVCDHPRRAAINRLLATDRRSLRDIAGRFGLSKSSVARHDAKCLPAALVAVAEAADLAESSTVLEQARDWIAEVRELFEDARDSGDLELALKATDRAGRWLDLVAKVTGELAPQRHEVSFDGHPEVRRFAAILRAKAELDPRLSALVLEALDELEGRTAAVLPVKTLGADHRPPIGRAPSQLAADAHQPAGGPNEAGTTPGSER